MMIKNKLIRQLAGERLIKSTKNLDY